MSNISYETKYKGNLGELVKSGKGLKKLTELSSCSNSTTTKHQAVLLTLSTRFSHIRNCVTDDDQEQNQSKGLVYICAGADLRKSPQKVDGLLINVVDHGITPKKYENANEMRRRTNPRYLILDSSGYQIHQAETKGISITFNGDQPLMNNENGVNIASNHVAQVAFLFNPDIMIGLDRPVLKLKSEGERENEFLKKKPSNVQLAFESYDWKNKLVPHVKYFQPIQGYTVDHFKTFLDEIEGVRFDGISMPVRHMNITEIAVILVYLYQRGIKNVHLLGTSAFSKIALLAYASRNMFDFIMLDSTSWRMAAQHHEFFYPADLSTERLGRKFNVNAVTKNPCKCNFCGGRSFHDIYKIEPRKAKVQLLLQHNYLMIENLVKDLFAKGDTIEVLGQELIDRSRTDYRRREVGNLIRVMSIVDSFKDGDLSILQAL